MEEEKIPYLPRISFYVHCILNITIVQYCFSLVINLCFWSSFRSMSGLKYHIQSGLDLLQASRKKLLDQLLAIDQTMEKPKEEDMDRVRYCRICYGVGDGPTCVHCELDEIFQVCFSSFLLAYMFLYRISHTFFPRIMRQGCFVSRNHMERWLHLLKRQ